MPRIARFVMGGMPHHVTQRGNRRGQVFFSDADCQVFLHLLREYAARFELEVLAYCLMSNHVHLVAVPATDATLARVLRPLHLRYAQRVNRARGWKGHLWQGRYFASTLDEPYMWAAIRYVERNPVAARMVARAEDYPWSSARARCFGYPDPVITTSGRWCNLLGAVANWPAWLAAGESTERIRILRRNSLKGLPCGSAAFVDQLEHRSGRMLHYRPQGRQARSDSGPNDTRASPELGFQLAERFKIAGETVAEGCQPVFDVRRNLGAGSALEQPEPDEFG